MIFQRVIGTTRLQKDIGLCDLPALLYNPTNLLYLGETLLVLLWLYCVCYGFILVNGCKRLPKLLPDKQFFPRQKSKKMRA